MKTFTVPKAPDLVKKQCFVGIRGGFSDKIHRIPYSKGSFLRFTLESLCERKKWAVPHARLKKKGKKGKNACFKGLLQPARLDRRGRGGISSFQARDVQGQGNSIKA